MTPNSPDFEVTKDEFEDLPLHRRAFDFATKSIRLEFRVEGTRLLASESTIRRVSNLAGVLEDIDEPLLAPGPTSREISRRCTVPGYVDFNRTSGELLVLDQEELFRLPWLILKLKGVETRVQTEGGRIFTAGLVPPRSEDE